MRLDFNSPIIFDRGLKIGNKAVGVLNGSFIYEPEEVENLRKLVFKVWTRISSVNRDRGFVGLIRFDFVPFFEAPSEEGPHVIDLGPLCIRGVYEVNAHAPECGAAVAALHRAAPHLAQIQPSPAERLAKAIRQTFGDQEIFFVPGSGPVKKAWGGYFFQELCRAGLRIRWSEPEQILKNPPSPDEIIIWRWGDLRTEGHTEYAPPFARFLREWRGTVFNTVPSSPEEDPGNKSFLIPTGEDPKWNSLVGENFVLSPERLGWARRNKDDLVLKPLGGSSGLDISFGRLLTQKEWEAKLVKALGQPYGLFEARWLPKVMIDRAQYAMDLNVACWASGGNIKYLYSLVRIDEWERYWGRGAINVARGAAFSGPPIDGL